MAENINIKVLIDAAQSAKTIQETKKALRDLRSAAMQVEEGTQAFTDLTTAAGQLQDRIGDLSATTKYLGDDLKNLKGLASIGQGIAGGFAIAQGAAALFGAENGKLEESILKVQSAMSVLQGIQAIGEVLQKESAATLFIQNGLRKTAILLTSEQAAAEAAEAVAAGTATVAQRALNAAMNANPILALVSLLAVAATALYAFSESTDEATKKEEAAKKASEARTKALKEEQEAFAKFVGDEAAGYLILAEQLKKTNPQSKERLDLIKDINETYGTTLKNLSDEETFQKQVNKSIEDYIGFLKMKYALQSSEELISKNIAKQAKLQDELAKKQAEYAYQRKAFNNENFKNWDLEGEINQINSDIADAERRLEGYVKNSLNLSAKITATGLKTSKERVETEKNTNSKIEKEREKHHENLKNAEEKYADSIANLQEFIYEKNAETLSAYNSLYEDTLQGQIDALKAQADQQILESNSKYQELIQAAQDAANAEVDAEIAAGKLILANRAARYDQLITNNLTYNNALRAQKSNEVAINAAAQKQISKLIEAETQKRLEAQRQVAKAVIAPQEFANFVDYINFVEKKTSAALEKSLLTFTRTTKVIKVDGEKLSGMKWDTNWWTDPEKAKKVKEEYKKTIVQMTDDGMKQFSRNAQILSNDERKALENKLIEYKTFISKKAEFDKENNDNIIKLEQKLAEQRAATGTTDIVDENQLKTERERLAMRVDDVARYAKEITEIEKKLQKDLSNRTDKRVFDTMLKNYTDYLKKTGEITKNTPLDNIATAVGEGGKKITEAVNEVADDLMNSRDIPKILDDLFSMSDYDINQTWDFIFAQGEKEKALVAKYGQAILQSDLDNTKEYNLKVSALYQDKYQALIDSEAIINKDREDQFNAQKAYYDQQVQALAEFNAKSAAEQAKMKAPVVPDAPTKKKKFAISPKDGEEGISSLAAEEAQKLNDILEKRNRAIEQANQKWYDQELFELYNQLMKKEISQEDYQKKSVELEEKFQQNLFDIQVVYGKKGQKDLNDRTNEKLAKEKASKEKFVQEMLALEQQLSTGIMDIINANSQYRIDNLNREYDLRVAAVQAEADAYDESLQTRTAAEIQAEQKKQAFQDEIDAINAERAAKEKQIKIENFEKQKAMDIIQAGINGAVAFTKALAETGPFALAIQGLVAASVAAQIGFISAQQPQFAEGGLVVGPGGPKDDMISAKLSNGEAVINAKSTKMYAPVLSAINQAGGGKAIPFAKGGIASTSSEPMVIGEKALAVDTSKLERAIKELNSRPIETYVKESRITAAQSQNEKERRRTSF